MAQSDPLCFCAHWWKKDPLLEYDPSTGPIVGQTEFIRQWLIPYISLAGI